MRAPCGARDDVAGEQIATTHLVVIGGEIGAEAGPVRFEDFGRHGEARDEARHMVGRAAEQPVGPFGHPLVTFGALTQIVPRFRLQIPSREALVATIVRVGHGIDMLRRALAIIDRGEGLGRIAKRRVHGDVADEFAADIDPAAVAQG